MFASGRRVRLQTTILQSKGCAAAGRHWQVAGLGRPRASSWYRVDDGILNLSAGTKRSKSGRSLIPLRCDVPDSGSRNF